MLMAVVLQEIQYVVYKIHDKQSRLKLNRKTIANTKQNVLNPSKTTICLSNFTAWILTIK